MDLNLVVVAGKLATEPEVRQFESGSRFVRYLVTVRSAEPRRRVDVIPVTLWDPTDDLLAAPAPPGCKFWAAGMIQRRFWSAQDGRRSRLEVVAHQVELRQEDAVAAES